MNNEIEVYEHDDDLMVEEEAERTDAEIAIEIVAAQADLAQLRVEADEIVSGASEESGSALVPLDQSPTRVKASLAAKRSQVARKSAEIQAKSKELEALMREQMARVQDVLEPMQKLVDQIEETIWTVNLYLGRDEEIVTLRDGEPAAAEEPLVIRQLVLAMDEETAIRPETEGIDAREIEAFDEWLLADPAHLHQVLPETKGVVALVPRFESKDYGDPWVNAAQRAADSQTYFLIRNGDQLYRMWTEFRAGRTLVPKSDEFTDFFVEERRDYSRGRDPHVHRIPIKPGTRAWAQAEERADARQRHYMRVALILQGLIDRTTVFHPLPPAGLGLLDRDHFKAGRVAFVMDADDATMLTTGRESFRDWQTRLNAQLRPGMRIIGSFGWSSRFRHEDTGHGHPRINPPHAPAPKSATLYKIEKKVAGGLLFYYERDDRIYSYRENHKPKRRASCVIYRDDSFILPFDLVAVEEMETYLNARLDRKHYASMFPILRAAILAKREEAEQEQPFRTMLAGVLARDNGVTVEQAEADVGELIDWWKLANRHHRPLVGSEDEQAKAVRAIVAEHARRLKAANTGRSERIVEQIQREHPDALLIGRRRNGRYVAVTPQNDGNVFVQVYDYLARGQRYEKPGEWKLLTKAWLARLTVLYESERLAEWDFGASLSEHLTGPEIELLGQQIVEGSPRGLIAVCYDPRKRRFYRWVYEKDAELDEQHPLTGEQHGPKIDERQIKWKRTTGQQPVLLSASWSNRPRYANQRRPWDTRGPDYAHWVGGDEDRNQYLVLNVCEPLAESVDAQRAKRDELRKLGSQMAAKVRAAIRSVEEQWLARAEALEYQRFLEDYADPELWEGHRKTLTIRYPHDHYRGGYLEQKDAFYRAAEKLVEEGVNIDGCTPVEIIERAGGQVDEIPEDIRTFAVKISDGEDDE